ncbi:MAG: AAA family ATPase, partial [Firmicutes bacterium]|nr:AAA family ATPase [Bacillota bacterium]
LAYRCAEGGEEVTDRLLGARGATLAAYEPSLAGLPGQAKFPPAPQLQGAAARDRLMACCADTLSALAEEGPVLLLIDDLQWADELTLRLLRTLPEGWFASRPLLFLGTYRNDAAPPEIAEIRSRSDARHIELCGVDAASASALVVDMLALKELHTELAELLVRQSQGNPFYIAKYLRTGIAEGEGRALLQRDELRRAYLGG